jgi:hypothetical protein
VGVAVARCWGCQDALPAVAAPAVAVRRSCQCCPLPPPPPGASPSSVALLPRQRWRLCGWRVALPAEGVSIDHALQHFVDDCRWLQSVDGFLVAHQLEYDAGIIYKELGRLPSLRSYGPLVKTLASRGICTMNVAARRRGWKIRQTSNCRAITLQDAFQLFVEPLGISKWDDTFYHDSRYDVHKTLELYDALYCHKS